MILAQVVEEVLEPSMDWPHVVNNAIGGLAIVGLVVAFLFFVYKMRD